MKTDLQILKRLAFVVNTVILGLVIGLMAFFKLAGATFLVYFSIPTMAVYIVGYFLIRRERLDHYVWMVYLWLTFYMGVTTVCLGYGYGFHLYCFSMIPITFVTEYMSYRLGTKRGIKAMPLSISIAVYYLVCTGFVAYCGPIYENGRGMELFFWAFNAVTVFGFLIYYTNTLIKSIIASEEKLKEIAHTDRLTGLYNRHYMHERLDSLPQGSGAGTLALADIDDFKRINDVYGHNAGDLVLRTVSDIMRRECTGCDIARWGGEEFLILIPRGADGAEDTPERMRREIEAAPVVFEGQSIKVTVTVGMAGREEAQSIDEWIQTVDERLYIGKKSGKNRVVRGN